VNLAKQRPFVSFLSLVFYQSRDRQGFSPQGADGKRALHSIWSLKNDDMQRAFGIVLCA